MTDHGEELDSVSGTATTGHQWDGIKELNTPLPRWWLITFYLTIIWAIGYWVVYPAWPLLRSNTPGILNYSSRANVAVELANLDRIRGEKMTALASAGESEFGASTLEATAGLTSGILIGVGSASIICRRRFMLVTLTRSKRKSVWC